MTDARDTPSEEAVEAAILAAANPTFDDGHTSTYYAGILTAAYAIDLPRIRVEERAVMRRVGQEDAQGCGPAVLAMLTGQTYAQVKASLDADPWVSDGGERDWRTHGLTHYVLDRYLVRHGFYLQRIYEAWGLREVWPPTPWAALHFARVVQPSGNGHFVAMDAAGVVFDPLREGAYRLSDWPEVQNVVGLVRCPTEEE